MQRIQYRLEDGVAVLRLDDGKANAMQGEFFEQLVAGLDRAEAEARALVLTGRERFFSGGLDLKALPALERAALKSTLHSFAQAMLRVFLSPLPVVCASPGHALAGGMVLYLAGDLRLAVDDGAFRYGLNEVAIGLTLPHWLLALCGQGVPAEQRSEVFLHGRVMTAAETRARGITHALVPPDQDLLAAALVRARELAGLDPQVHGATKRRLRLPAFGGITGWQDDELDDFLGRGAFAATSG